MDMQNSARKEISILPFTASGGMHQAGLQLMPCLRSLNAASIALRERYIPSVSEAVSRLFVSTMKNPLFLLSCALSPPLSSPPSSALQAGNCIPARCRQSSCRSDVFSSAFSSLSAQPSVTLWRRSLFRPSSSNEG